MRLNLVCLVTLKGGLKPGGDTLKVEIHLYFDLLKMGGLFER